jgi:hypothetical protein
MKTLFAILSVATLALRVWAQEPQMSAEYKQAAQAYYDAAAKDPANASCDKAWGDYYTCVAASLVSGTSVTCTQPTCQPGTGQTAAPTKWNVNGQPTSQNQFQSSVQAAQASHFDPSIPNPSRDQVIANAASSALQTIGQDILAARQQERAEKQQQWEQEQAAADANANAHKTIMEKEAYAIPPDSEVSSAGTIVTDLPDASAFASSSQEQIKKWILTQLETFGTFVSIQKGIEKPHYGEAGEPDSTGLIAAPTIYQSMNSFQTTSATFQDDSLKYTVKDDCQLFTRDLSPLTGNIESDSYKTLYSSDWSIPLNAIDADKIQVKVGNENLNCFEAADHHPITIHRIDQSEQNTMWNVSIVSKSGSILGEHTSTTSDSGQTQQDKQTDNLDITFLDKAAACKFAVGLKALLDPSSIKTSQTAAVTSLQAQQQAIALQIVQLMEKQKALAAQQAQLESATKQPAP